MNQNQCGPVVNEGFVEDLPPLFKGTLNICSHRNAISTGKARKRCCSHFDKLDAITLSLKA